MGNYKDLEFEFIERTLLLLEQYEIGRYSYKFNKQYNHTLLINCLLGLIVMPKERTLSFIPKQKLTSGFKTEIGLINSKINPLITDLRELIISLRHSVAHFDLTVESYNEDFLIDEIVFKDKQKGEDIEIIRFAASELLPFLRYYANWVLNNYKKNLKKI